MIQNYIMAPDRLVHNVNRPLGAVKAWNSLDALSGKQEKIQTYDTPEQMERCDSCPLPESECKGSDVCRYRLGMPKPRPRGRLAKPKPPAGYDEERLKAAMVHNYLDEDIAAAMGISKHMVKKWIAWRWR